MDKERRKRSKHLLSIYYTVSTMSGALHKTPHLIPDLSIVIPILYLRKLRLSRNVWLLTSKDRT